MERRRRIPRQHAGWVGKYKIVGLDGAKWQNCFVVDISMFGVGLELVGLVPRDMVGREIEVEVQAPVGVSVTIYLLGRIRHATRDADGHGARVGLEFVGVTDAEQSILKTLEMMQVAW